MKLKDFLARLYQNCEGNQVETRALPSRKQTFHALGDWQGIEAWCERHRSQNLYFSVATRNGGGTKEHITQIPAVWCDIDFKDVPKEEAERRLREFPLRPSLVVNSGGGYHPYWVLKEPLGREDIPRVEAVLRQIQVFLGGDLAATDASRILRLPGTFNHKYQPARLVTVHTSNDFAYILEDIAEDLPGGDGISSEPSKASNFNKKDTYNFSESEGEAATGTEAGQSGTRWDIDFTKGHQDNSLFHIAWHLAKSGMNPQNVLKTLTFLARSCDPTCNFERWAKDKTRSAFDRLQRKETSLAEEIRTWVRDTTGTFSGTDWDKFHGSGTRRDKENRRKILLRLEAEGFIERVGPKDGVYRRVERECEDIDFLNVSGDELDVTWPLEIESLFKVYPRNLVVVAGDPDAGKTAFLLNLAKLNMDVHKVHYFSSEMGAQELHTRLKLFTDIPVEKWRFHPKERASNFADVILPDDFNVIDFLEIHDNFYQIGGMLKDIHDKLKAGIAVVAIQKARGAPLGRGGSFSLEKPRLYVTLSRDGNGNVATIEKCKNWRSSMNPNGLQRRFKLYQGAKFVPVTDWQRPQ